MVCSVHIAWIESTGLHKYATDWWLLYCTVLWPLALIHGSQQGVIIPAGYSTVSTDPNSSELVWTAFWRLKTIPWPQLRSAGCSGDTYLHTKIFHLQISRSWYRSKSTTCRLGLLHFARLERLLHNTMYIFCDSVYRAINSPRKILLLPWQLASSTNCGYGVLKVKFGYTHTTVHIIWKKNKLDWMAKKEKFPWKEKKKSKKSL